MTVKAEINVGLCDAVFLGENPLGIMASFNSIKEEKILSGGEKTRIRVVDNGSKGGGTVMVYLNRKGFGSIHFRGEGLASVGTIKLAEDTVTIAEIIANKEVQMTLTTSDKVGSQAVVDIKT